MSQSPVMVNPLQEGIRKEVAGEPCAMVILGAHGDLTKRKLLPALYALFINDLLPAGFCIVGLSRTKMTDEQFRASMKEAIQNFASDLTFDEKAWDHFASAMYYRSSNFSKEEGFNELADFLDDLQEKHGTRGNNIFYMATPPSLYSDIVDRLSESRLAQKKPGQRAPWPRIIVEKPFGRDLASAKELDEHIHKVFAESQVFRIDHYLGKETVQNIMVLRFANSIFEPIWNRNHIDNIQITNAETIGVEGRGGYYEEAGNMRDMIQNHMLQLVSLVAMEPPISMDAEATRDEKAKVLRAMRPFDLKNLDRFVVRGQYGAGWVNGQQVPGYREEPSVSPQSNTETFTALKLHIDNWRWADVPIYVRSGKRLTKGLTEVAITFKRPPLKLFAQSGEAGDALGPNILVLHIQPDEGISLKFATKQPGTTTQLRWLSMDFKYGTAFGVRSPSAYERLVYDCILGDSTLFARTDAVDASWALITPVLEQWQKQPPPDFPNYAAGTWGPANSDALLAADGRRWRLV
ncbi:MAG TPA: glucose-6-phosphate dehydrogenase [Candidatus Obscuribacterales bacterium]